MEFKEIEKLNKEFAKLTEKMTSDFITLFNKYMKKDPRATMILMLHLPLNLMLNIVDNSKIDMNEIFPEFPDMYIRFMKPFIILREKWGKIPNKQFVKEYGELYEKQFNHLFPSEEYKNAFEIWIKGENK